MVSWSGRGESNTRSRRPKRRAFPLGYAQISAGNNRKRHYALCQLSYSPVCFGRAGWIRTNILASQRSSRLPSPRRKSQAYRYSRGVVKRRKRKTGAA